MVQLRQENLRADSYNLVGFQNHLKFGEQARILRMIPGLEHAEFLRFGQIHRNTYINAPALLTPTLQLRARPSIFFAGQISGVEGYVESIATGLIAGRNAAEFAAGGAELRAVSAGNRARLALPLHIGSRSRQIISPRTSHSTCCPRSMRQRRAGCGMTRKRATRRSAGGRSKISTNSFTRMSELELQIGRFLEELKRNNASAHTIKAYESDLRQFLDYFSPPGMTPPGPAEFDVLKIREWLASLYDHKLTVVSIRRKLAAARVFFRFLVREGLAPMNTPRLLRTPRAPKKLPDVMTTEQANALLDGVAAGKARAAAPGARSRDSGATLRVRSAR